MSPFLDGWGGRIRTSEWRDQNPLPYRLATPHRIRQRPDSTPSCSSSHRAASGERLRPRTTYPVQRAGSSASAASASASVGTGAYTQEPVPVSRAGANRPSQSSASATAGKRRLTTGSQSFRPPAFRKPRIVITGESLVNSGASNTSAVLTLVSGRTSTYQRPGKSTGVSTSPTPSAQAALPWTKTGTSAPSSSPMLAKLAGRQPKPPQLVQRHQYSGRIRTATAHSTLHR